MSVLSDWAEGDVAVDHAAAEKLYPGFAETIQAFAWQTLKPADCAERLDEFMTKAGRPEGKSLSAPEGEDEWDVDADTEVELTEEVREQGPEFYIRPSGDKYYPRAWGDMLTDVQVLQKSREIDKPVFFYGPPGTGKTAAVEAAFGDELTTILGTGDTELSDLMGSYIPDPSGNGSFIWQDGPLVKAAVAGTPVLIDEIGVINPKVLTGVYSFMDGRREYRVTANPDRGVVKAAPGFFIVAATNPNAIGVNLSEALLSRFALQVEVTTDYALAEKLGVDGKVVRISKSLNNSMQNGGGVSWAPQFRELMVYKELEKTFGRKFAIENLIASAPEQDRDQIGEDFSKMLGTTYLPARV